MRVFLLCGLASLALWPAPVATADPPFGPILPSPTPEQLDGADLIANPRWITRANGADFAAAYPRDARDEGVEGGASVDCLVQNDGWLACRIEDDGTAYNFELAALLLSSKFRMQTEDAQGAPTSGRRYKMRILFRLSDRSGASSRAPRDH